MEPRVTTVVNFYENKNQGYLDLCLESLIRQQNVDQEIIVISASIDTPNVPKNVRLVKVEHTEKAAFCYNLGAKLARPTSTHIFTVNDDVICGRDSVSTLAKIVSDNPIILNPLSNDTGGLFYTQMNVENTHGATLELKNSMRIDDIEYFQEAIMDIPGQASRTMLFPVTHLFMFSTMFRRKDWESLGGYDEINLAMTGDDIDLGIRADQKGLKMCITPNAFVFHFGGVTSSENMTKRDRTIGFDKFYEKWNIDLSKVNFNKLCSLENNLRAARIPE